MGPKGYVGTSCKLHLSGDERLSCRGGDTIPLFDLGFCKVGQIVCYDNHFPEVARTLALKGADVILMPHAGGIVVLGPSGQVIAGSQTELIEDEMVVADLDPALLDQARGQHNYTLANRRPELYAELVRPVAAP